MSGTGFLLQRLKGCIHPVHHLLPSRDFLFKLSPVLYP